MPPQEFAELLIEPRWVLPIAPANTALADHAVAVSEGRIVAIGPAGELKARFAVGERVVRPEHALLPGFVNAHTQASKVYLRGLATSSARRDSPDFVREGTTLAVAEMLQAGITCFADATLFPEEAARVASSARIRAAIGLPLSDVANEWAETATEHLARAEQLWDTYKADPWVSLYFAVSAPSTIGDATLLRLRRVADELDARVAMPVHDSVSEISGSVTRTGKRPIERLQSLGLLRPGFSAIHFNHAGGPDIDVAIATGIAVVACPQTGIRLGQGICPVSRLMAGGVPVGLGCGNPVYSGALDMLAEARAVALADSRAMACGESSGALSGGGGGAMRADAGAAISGDAFSVSALRAATLGGAMALGMASQIGSIEVGKAADLVCVDLGELACQPFAHPASALVYSATRSQVRDVWISGRAAVAEGRLLTFDTQELLALARHWADRVRQETTV